jgi:uncharacterized repeat protein (TIGR02543 family)
MEKKYMGKFVRIVLFVVFTAVITAACGVDEKSEYTVEFNSNGGSAIGSLTVGDGETINAPDEPTKSEYEFGGWYKDDALTDKWDFNGDKVTRNATLYAKWVVILGTDGLNYELNSDSGSYSVTGYTGEETDIRIPAEYNGLPVTLIADEAFADKTAVTSVVIPSGIVGIGTKAFWECNSLADVTFGTLSRLTNIGIWAFTFCNSLESIGIPQSVTDIGDYAFAYCNNLRNINIPDNVTSIGAGVFGGCGNLTAVTFGADSKLTSIGRLAFIECLTLSSINIPKNVESIGYGMFGKCGKLTAVTFGAGSKLTSIEDLMFSECGSLEFIEIPDSVTFIGESAFNGCLNLKSVNLSGTEPPILEVNVFQSTHADLKIYVPSGSEETYKSANGWKKYADNICSALYYSPIV